MHEEVILETDRLRLVMWEPDFRRDRAFPTLASRLDWPVKTPTAVILGLEPRIHRINEIKRLWILGSSPRMTAVGCKRLD